MATVAQTLDPADTSIRRKGLRCGWAGLARIAAVVLLLAAALFDTPRESAAAGVRDEPAASSLQMPPGSAGFPVKVTIALVLLNITDVDEVEQRFHVNAYLFMRWRDPRLKPPLSAPSADPTMYGKGQIWHPTVELVNSVDPRQIVDATTSADADGVVSYTERFSAAVTSKFALRRFPFDSQTLNLVVRPYVGERREFSLVADSRVSRTVPEFKLYSSLGSWDAQGLGARVAAVEAADGATVSEARFQLSLRRKSGFYVWKVIFPLLLMVALSWTVFWIEANDLTTQVQIAVTTVLTIIAFAFAISGNLPRVSYLTYIDAFFLTCYLFVFIAIAELMSVNLSHRTRGAELAQRIRRHSRWVVPSAFLITNALLLVNFGII